MRATLASSALGVLLAALGAFVALGLRVPFEPSMEETLTMDVAAKARWGLLVEAALLAAVATAFWIQVVPFVRVRAGAFGACCAIACSGGLAALGAGLPMPAEWMWGCAFFASVLAAVLSPLLRERSVLSLALGGVAMAMPFVVAMRCAHGHARSSIPLAAVAREAVRDGGAGIALLLGDGVDEETAFAIGLRMAAPFVASTVDVFVARADSQAGTMLRRIGAPLLQLAGSKCEAIAPAPETLGAADGIEIKTQREEGAAQPLLVRWERAVGETDAACIVMTRFGSVEGKFAESGLASFPAAEIARLRRWLDAMPSGGRIRVVAVPPSAADPAVQVSFAP